jgi:hypothetical protein
METKPRLSIPISREQQKLLQQLVPWGALSPMFRLIIDDFILMFEKHGAAKVLGAFMERAVELEDIIRTKVE